MAHRQFARLVLIVAFLEMVVPIIAGISLCCQEKHPSPPSLSATASR